MTQNDPTDRALVAITGILHSKKSSQAVAEPAAGDETVTVAAERVTVTVEQESFIAATDAPTTVPDPNVKPAEIDGYTRLGPGPLDAIRFRWTARRAEDGRYFVDETIGMNSRPMSSGPMPRDQVIAFIDARESAARERFQTLKRQMTLSRQAPDTEIAGEG